jgi:hypothetical protein
MDGPCARLYANSARSRPRGRCRLVHRAALGTCAEIDGSPIRHDGFGRRRCGIVRLRIQPSAQGNLTLSLHHIFEYVGTELGERFVHWKASLEYSDPISF